MITLEAISSSMCWVAWQTQLRDDAGPDDKPSKVPYGPHGKARADDPSTWTTRAGAAAIAARLPKPFGAGGIGLELTDNKAGTSLGGVDLDTCMSDDGTIAAWAMEVIERLGSYTEVSPSGTGMKVYFTYQTADLGELRSMGLVEQWGRSFKKGTGKHPPAIEVHLGNRYFAVTDQRFDGTPIDLRQISLDTLVWLLRDAGPTFAGKTDRPDGKDGSRSAIAFRKGGALRRAGKTFTEMVDALRADPETADWVREKGEADNQRELHRIWDKAGAAPAHAEQVFDPWNALQHPDFPIDALPSVLHAFVEDRACTIGADPCAIAWAAISACSVAIHGGIRLRMKQHDSWSVPPAIWVALVGLPSTKKTPIIDAGWEPLHHAQAADLRHWKQELRAWMTLPKSERGEKPIPRRRLITHNATPEAIQDLLESQDRGIGVLHDELAGFICGLENYNGGKGGGANRAFYLEAHNGGPRVVDRVGRGTVSMENMLVTVCGGIQPDRLRQLGNLTDDGLWQRFIPIITAPASMGQDDRARPAVHNYGRMIEQLLEIDGRTRVQLSAAAHDIRRDVEQRVFNLEQSAPLGSAFTSFCGKLTGMWGRLALVLSQLDPDQAAPFVAGEQAADRARSLIFGSALPNAARIYTAMGGAGGDMEATRSIAGFVLVKEKTRLLASDLTRNVHACRGMRLDDIHKTVSPLVAGGWLVPEQEFNTTAWTVNPIVHTQFAERAKQEAARREAVRNLIVGHEDQDPKE